MSKAKNRFHPLSPRKVEQWHQLDLEVRAELIVTDERRDWILRTYPPNETGRPGILVNSDGRTTQTKEAIADKVEASEVCPENGQEQMEETGEDLLAIAAG